MTETIKLMQAHSSVRRFKEQEIPQEHLNEILKAAQMASSWKNFQSYSVILVRSQEKKDALFELVPQEAIRQSAAFLLFVGDLNRAEKELVSIPILSNLKGWKGSSLLQSMQH